MAIDVDWTGVETNPYRIYVPRADMPLLQASPEIRQLDADAFRLALKDLEADPAEGIMWPDTHQHNTPVVQSGVVYDRFVSIIPPYTLEFEDGNYGVSVTGANVNFLDVKVANSVSLLLNNSAGRTVVESSVTVPTASEVADAVWDEPTVGHLTTGTFGRLVSKMLAVLNGILGSRA